MSQMFAQLSPVSPRRQPAVLGTSVVLHLVFLGWLLHSPAPIFVAPSYVVKGGGGTQMTQIYFGGKTGVTQAKPAPRVLLPPTKAEKRFGLEPPPPKKQEGNQTTASNRSGDIPGGSLYGSLSYGQLLGLEVRPALPIVSVDPAVDPDLLEGMIGDVVVEITIDRDGNITEMSLLQSFRPAVDQIVLAALGKWHFLPATRNGTPIPSKQDVHYHFPH